MDETNIFCRNIPKKIYSKLGTNERALLLQIILSAQVSWVPSPQNSGFI